MRASLLGPLRVEEDGRPLPVGGPRQRAVLAYLLLHANTMIPSARLLTALWGDDAPAGAANALQAAVSRLRKVLPAGRLVTTTQGYLLHLAPDELDVDAFEREMAHGTRALDEARSSAQVPAQTSAQASARESAREAARILASALALWRGAPLADFRYEPFAQTHIARLEELHIACREARIQAELDGAVPWAGVGRTGAGGRDGDGLVAELRELVAQHPLRERLHGLLMQALYRSGRQGEALEVYRDARTLLATELGIEPSPALARIERAVLRQEPWLAGAAAVSATVSATGPADPLGSAARGPAATPSRRPVTVVHIDLTVDGTTDPETLALTQDRVATTLDEVVRLRAGRLQTVSGHGFAALFGVASVHEDDALRGVLTALDCDAALRALDDGSPDRPPTASSHRIGVATAEALVTDPGSLAFVGEATGLAQQLAEAATPTHRILLGEQTVQLTSAAVQVERLPSGRSALAGARVGVRPHPLRLEAPTLGRAHELAVLEEWAHTARRTRSPVFVTVLGEAGQGKTRTVLEFTRRHAGTATILTGRALPYGQSVTFWPLRELVEQAVGGQVDPAAVRALLGSDPDAQTVTDRLMRAFGAGEAGTSDTTEINWATRRVLEALARDRPLIVVLDDLHWAQPAFLSLVESLAAQGGKGPVVVLCLARPDLLDERPRWLAAAASATTVRLSPLDDDAAGALADELARPAVLPAATRARLLDTAGGNPLYLEQLVALLDEKHWVDEGGALPATIQALLAARLDRLGPAERSVLGAASVVGRDVDAADLAVLVPGEVGRRLSWHLQTLVAKALLQPPAPGGRAGRYRFAHVLVQEAAYRAIPKATRAELHEQLADRLEPVVATGRRQGVPTGPTSPELADPGVAVLAHHLSRAAQLRGELRQGESARRLGTRATTYLSLAGDAALALGDGASAAKAFESARALLPQDDPRLPAALTGLSAALFDTGRLSEAKVAVDGAQDAAVRLDDPVALAHARVQALLLGLHHEPADAVAVVEPELPGLRATFRDAQDDVGLCRSYLLEAALSWNRSRAGDAEQAWSRAADYARAAVDARHLTRSLRWLSSAALWGPTPASEGIARCRGYLREIGDTPVGRSVIELHMAGLHAMTDDLGTARRLLAGATASLGEVSAAMPAAMAEPAAFVAMIAGDPAAAEEQLRGAAVLLRGMGEKSHLATFSALIARAVVLADPSRHAQARALIEESWANGGDEDLSARVIGHGVLARIASTGPDVERGLAHGRLAVELAATTDLLNQHADALVDLAHAYAHAGRPGDAETALLRARDLYRRKENVLGARSCDRLLVAAREG